MTAFTIGYSFNAYVDARKNGLMNPSLTPCFFSKVSPISFLRVMKLLISISLNVVNIAAVFYASLSLPPILILILLIGTLTSVLVPVMPVGAFPDFDYGVGVVAIGLGVSIFLGGASSFLTSSFFTSCLTTFSS